MASLIRCARTSVDEYISRIEKILPIILSPLDYAQTYLKDTISFWQKYFPIILNLPTGSGKTTLILKEVIPYAIEREKQVLIVSNRIVLDIAYKRQVAKMFGLYEDYPDELLRKIDDYGLVKIITYQKLPKYLSDSAFCESIDYLVLDEVHYFTSDALFSKNTGWLLQKIPQVFSNSVRVYMSATMDEVLPYICQAELHKNAVSAWKLYGKAIIKYKGWLSLYENLFFRKDNPLIAKILKEYTGYYPEPLIFKMKADYSHISLYFYSDDNVPKDIIQRSSHKSIWFVDNKKRGSLIANELSDTNYMDADTIQKDASLMNDIINNESFEAKTLVTTSVFCNGCNICDAKVKDVFIEPLDKTDIQQMIGRRRKLSGDDSFTAYLRIPSIDMLESRIRNMQKILDIIKMAKTDNDKYLNLLLNGDYSVKNVSNIVFVKDGKLHFNQIAIDMLLTRIVCYENLIDLLQTEGEDGYCKKIAKELFDKDFTPDMIVSYRDYRAETIEWLDSLLDKTLSKEELDNFGAELIDRIQTFNREAKERKDRNLGCQAINNRLKNNNLPYEVRHSNDSYIIVKEQSATII